MGAGEVQLDPSWRTNKKSIKSKLGYILSTEGAYHDVTFLVGKGQKEMKAHKLILMVSSLVFEEMLEDGSCSSEGKGTRLIPLPDVQPEALHCLLKFIYTDKLEVTLEDAMSVLYAAKKFNIPELSDRCLELLKANISERNVIGIFQSAQVHAEEELRDCALQFILRKADSLINSEEFLQLKYEDLCLILESDELFVEELKIFKFALRWAREECKRFDMDDIGENHRYVLKKGIYLLRFPLLSVEQFSMHVVPSGILSSSEMVELYQFYTTPPALKAQLSLSNQATMLFNSSPRRQPTYKSPQASPGNSLTQQIAYLSVGDSYRGPSAPPSAPSVHEVVKQNVHSSILHDRARQLHPAPKNTNYYGRYE